MAVSKIIYFLVFSFCSGSHSDFSDYKEHKLTDENIGFKMLQKAGWNEGAGLGSQKQGITAPVNK